MKLLNFAIIKMTICLIIGIGLTHVWDFPVRLTVLFIILLLVGLALTLLVERKGLEKSLVFSLLTYVTFIGIGALTYQLQDQKKSSRHYSQHLESKTDVTGMITFRINKVLKPGSFHEKYIIDILQIDGNTLSGKALLNVQKDSLQAPFNVDAIIATSAPLTDIGPALNPHQFDYGNYLEKQQVYHQIFTDHHHLITLSTEIRTIFGLTAQWRERVNSKLIMYGFKTDERALINALLLGQRHDISKDIYDDYSKAGAVHILAVSGLHVGIILLLLTSLLKPVEYLKHGKLIKVFLIVLILWTFAIIAGLSASVTRAVTMFSIVAIGMHLKRPSNIYNTLAISMFFLLLFKPMFLFDVGFQMSYLAVLAIVSFQPMIEKWWQPKFKPLYKLWQIFTVTLAAQLGVVPISLFYFHQFPGLFFLSNLVIIPFLGLILGLGIVVIFMALTDLLPLWLAEVYGTIISEMTAFVKWIALQEKFVMTDISFGLLQVLAAYLLILTLFFLFKKQNFKRLSSVMVAVLLFQMSFLWENSNSHGSELVVFHKNRHTLIGITSQSHLNILKDFDQDISLNDPIIRNYKIGKSISQITEDTLQNLYFVRNETFLIVDSLGIYQVPELFPNYILLRNSPKINLTRLLNELRPDQVIADGSNYRSYLSRWEESCKKQNTPFHRTGRAGAFIVTSE